MGAFLAKCGVGSIRTFIMIVGGIAVDKLKTDVKILPKLKKISLPISVRKAIVKALEGSSWFALLTVFRWGKCVGVSGSIDLSPGPSGAHVVVHTVPCSKVTQQVVSLSGLILCHVVLLGSPFCPLPLQMPPSQRDVISLGNLDL